MGCTSCCGTRDLPDAHATRRTQCVLRSHAHVHIVGRLVLLIVK